MGRFLNGVLVGIGIGLLVAPMNGEEMRRLVSERFEHLKGTTSNTGSEKHRT